MSRLTLDRSSDTVERQAEAHVAEPGRVFGALEIPAHPVRAVGYP
jgi:hypothetical protein